MLAVLLLASCLPTLSGCRHVSPSFGTWTVIVDGVGSEGPVVYDFGDGTPVPAFPGLMQELVARYGDFVLLGPVSPDGRRVVFTVLDPTPPTVERPYSRDLAYVVDVAGPPWNIVPLPEDMTKMTWSPDGRRLACLKSGWDRLRTTWTYWTVFIDVVSRKVVRWEFDDSHPVGPMPPAFSPDGTKFAYTRYDAGIALLDVATGRVDTALVPGSTRPELVTWLPDGRMAYSDNDGGRLLLGRPGEDAFTVLPMGPDMGHPISCRPDGGAVMYTVSHSGGRGWFGMNGFQVLSAYVTFSLWVRYADGGIEELDMPVGSLPDAAVWMRVP